MLASVSFATHTHTSSVLTQPHLLHKYSWVPRIAEPVLLGIERATLRKLSTVLQRSPASAFLQVPRGKGSWSWGGWLRWLRKLQDPSSNPRTYSKKPGVLILAQKSGAIWSPGAHTLASITKLLSSGQERGLWQKKRAPSRQMVKQYGCLLCNHISLNWIPRTLFFHLLMSSGVDVPVRAELAGVGSLILLYGSWQANVGYQPWRQAPLLTEASR